MLAVPGLCQAWQWYCRCSALKCFELWYAAYAFECALCYCCFWTGYVDEQWFPHRRVSNVLNVILQGFHRVSLPCHARKCTPRTQSWDLAGACAVSQGARQFLDFTKLLVEDDSVARGSNLMTLMTPGGSLEWQYSGSIPSPNAVSKGSVA